MINLINLMGRLVADPELKTTRNGKEFAVYTLAVEKNIKNADGKKDCNFIPCYTYGQTANLVNRYFRKGQMMAVVGELNVRNYKDKEGVYRTDVGVVTSQISFCGDYSKEEKPAQQQQTKKPVNVNVNDFEAIADDEDLPF